jgi:hypothetical protein
MILGRIPVPSTVWSGDDMDNGLHLNDPRPRVHAPDRLDGGDRGTDELMLQFEAAPMCERVEPCDFSPDPGPVRDLVHRAVERGGLALVADDLCHGPRKPGEALDEGRGPDVNAIRPAVMTKVPNDLHADVAGRVQHR